MGSRPRILFFALYIWKGPVAAGASVVLLRGSVPCAPVHEAQGHQSRRYSRPYELWWPSFQSISMPFDFETAICSGSVVSCVVITDERSAPHHGRPKYGASRSKVFQAVFYRA